MGWLQRRNGLTATILRTRPSCKVPYFKIKDHSTPSVNFHHMRFSFPFFNQTGCNRPEKVVSLEVTLLAILIFITNAYLELVINRAIVQSSGKNEKHHLNLSNRLRHPALRTKYPVRFLFCSAFAIPPVNAPTHY